MRSWSRRSVPAAEQARAARFSRRCTGHREYLLLLLPALIIFVLFRYIPMAGIVIAFKKYTIAGGLFGSPWVGFTYFERLFASEKFYQVLWNSIRISFLKIAIGFPGPIIFALLLNEVRQLTWKKSLQTISYLPHFVSWVVVGGIARDVLSVYGIFNTMIGLVRRRAAAVPAGDALVPADRHQLHDLEEHRLGIDHLPGGDHQHRSAALRGGRDRRARGGCSACVHVTLPSITHVIIILFLLRIGNVLEAGFDQIFNLYNPLVYDVADIIDTYVYREGISGFQYSLTAAASLFQNVVGLMLLLLVNVVTRRVQADYSVV